MSVADQRERLASSRLWGEVLLARIAADGRFDYGFHSYCQYLWTTKQREASVSLEYGDADNAAKILDHGLHVLIRGPALFEEGLSLEDALSLMSGI